MKLTAGTSIECELDTLRQKTQTPEHHVRWDMRFSDIDYLPKSNPDEPQRFRYATRIGFGKEIAGWGETIADRDGKGSALRFGSNHAFSLIREGAGCWIYKTIGNRVLFKTVYDYRVRYGLVGQIADRVMFRPLMIWATRWSFDRLRIWMERRIVPEIALKLWSIKVVARIALGLVWILEGLLPKIISIRPDEIDLVFRSGWFLDSPAGILHALGAVQVVGGLWLISGRTERTAIAIATLIMILLTTLVFITDPSTLFDPLGGIVKNLALLAVAVTVWCLNPITPNASRAKERG
jgi:uncharacterized membrane protein YphA (DoxX/SURF4 family)